MSIERARPKAICLDTTGIDTVRFSEALRRVAMEERLSEGFSVYSEKAVHKAVKLYVEPDSLKHEIPLLGGVADIFNDNGVTEVQTGAFTPLVPKLRRILPEHPVTIIHPFALRTAHRWLDPDSGEISSPERKGSARSIYSAARNLYGIREFIGHPNLSVRILAYECEEFRRLDGWGKAKRRGATLLGRLPTRLVGELVLRDVRDYAVFIPRELGSQFTQSEFLKASGSRSRYDKVCVPLLEHLGAIRLVGKQGRAHLYEKVWDFDN